MRYNDINNMDGGVALKKIKLITCISGLILLLGGCGSYKGELVAAGSNTSKVYHKDDCKLISNVEYEKLFLFSNLEETARRGYRPCKTCSPPTNIEIAKELYDSYLNEFEELKLEFEKHKEYLDDVYEKEGKDWSSGPLFEKLKMYEIETEFMTVEEYKRYSELLYTLEELKSCIDK